MKSLLIIAMVLAIAMFNPASALEEGERTYQCWKLIQPAEGSTFAVRSAVHAHDRAEAIALCEVDFDTADIRPLITGRQLQVKTLDGGTLYRREVFVPKFLKEPTAVAETVRK